MKSYRCVLAGMALVMTACAALAQAPAAPASAAQVATPPAQSAQSALDARLLYQLLLGEIVFGQGDTQAGAGYILDAARRTGDEALFKRAAEMAIIARSGPAALDATHAWRQAQPDSVEAARFELQVLVALGRVGETEAPLRELLTLLPEAGRESFIMALPALYQRAPDKALAARTVESALSNATQTPALAPAAWACIGRLRLQAGDKAGALAAATLGQTAGAPSRWPALLALQLLTDAQAPDAEALVQRYLATPQAKPEVRVDYARALADLGRTADASAQLDALTKQQPDYIPGWLVKGALLADERRDDEAEQALRHFLQLADAQAGQPGAARDGGRSQARMMLASIAERRDDLAAAQQWLQQIDAPDRMLAAQLQRADLLARQGKLDEARQVIQAAPERRPEDARTKLLAEAQLLRDHQQPEQAYQMLSDALQNTPDDEALLYDAAMTAERLDRMQDMERLLRHQIEIDPKAASAYNALGYSLADRGLRLPEAKELIEKALQLAPDDSFIQDSLGWVEFRLGQMQEARRILEAAYKARPDAEIAAHLGEVLWTLGEQDAARAIWRDGQRLNRDNETLTKTLERLKVTL